MKKNMKNASITLRIYAYMIDLLIEMTLSLIFTLGAYSILSIGKDIMIGYFLIVCLIISFLWLFVYIPSKNEGQTIGKSIFKIYTVNEYHRTISLSKCLIREYLLKFLLCPIFIMTNLIWLVYSYVRSKHLPEEMPQDILLKTRVIQKQVPSKLKLL